ncbi:tryptophan halogenase [Devosia pacifica]|uniref:Tryptophan halogenase n=1 Tax=Devosia pacifica TaxID=1335967 RepID=A0A918SCI0_9HYPH|nr:tryptophan halogenase family protein [Devosia pacifica]GHA34462.1 tryptophan halogenase [Devosia pacifica]
MSDPAHFVIVGGGTAGWLAAFILQDAVRRKSIDARISVIESTKIPNVGVGEATTAAFRVLLQYFRIDEFEFFRKTEATFKLGIRHQDWRRKGYTYYGPIDDPHQVVKTPKGVPSDFLNVYSVAAGRPVQDMHLFQPLLEQHKAPYAFKDDGSLIALGPYHHAYHFDQALVGKFFAEKAEGVDVIDALVSDIERNAETGDIAALRLDDGTRLKGDFFIDATGFRKQLIVKGLDASWISYANELPVNRALPFWLDIGEDEEIATYTRAWAQDSGWMWMIPTQSRYGCGYVYSDAHTTADEAKREVEQRLGREIEVRGDIRFSVGRLETPWKNNCLAVGLSSSFLEPLESTSIHGTIVQMMMFAEAFLKAPEQMTPTDRDGYNSRVARQVDDFRTFVNTHYMTERDDTPFWRDVRENRIHGETRRRLDFWKRHMPRREQFRDYLGGLPHIETQLYYPVLDGLGLLDQSVARQEMERTPKLRRFAQQTVEGLTREYRAAAGKAIGHSAFLRHVRDMR